MAMHIPESFMPAIVAIADMDPTVVDKLSEALPTTRASLSLDHILATVESNIGAKIVEGQVIFDLLLSLYRLQIAVDDSCEEIIEELSVSVRERLENDSNDPDQKYQNVIANLKKLFVAKSAIRISAKARDLFTENQANFRNARIISDIRPVYDEEDEGLPVPENAFVNHNLKIEYSEEAENKQAYYALDSNDLKMLKIRIERALQKEEQLSDTLIKQGTCVLKASDLASSS